MHVSQIICYLGGTVRPLHERVTEQILNLFHILSDPLGKQSDDYLRGDCDTYNLGGNVVEEHVINSRIDFDLAYTVFYF